LDCIGLVKIIPSISKTLRQSKFSYHAVYGAVQNYTIGIRVGNWGSEGALGQKTFSDLRGRDFATPGLELLSHCARTMQK